MRPGDFLRITSAGIAMLCAPLSGCISTAMTARNAHVPVLVGPVPCIDCPAIPPPSPAAGGPSITDSAARRLAHTPLPLGELTLGNAYGPKLDVKGDAAAPDACTSEVRVSRIDVHAYAVDALFYNQTRQRIDVDGQAFTVRGGSCGPWPAPASPVVVAPGGTP